MSIISCIASVRNAGVLRDFTWPNDLPTFGRYNLFYGWNGSGKTTLGRLFRALELKRPPNGGDVELKVNGARLPGQQFPSTTLPIRVFNRDFVTESVFPSGGGEVPPILIVGRENVEKQKRVEELKLKSLAAQRRYEGQRNEKDHATQELDRYCKERAREIKDRLRFTGTNPYNNYDKAAFRARAEQSAKETPPMELLSDAECDKLFAQHRATPKAKVQEIDYKPVQLDAFWATTTNVLSTTVLTAGLDALKGVPFVAAWVRDGLRLHKHHGAEQCLFCEQAMPAGRLAALEAHFGAQYESLLAAIDEQVKNLERAAQATTVRLPSRAEFYEDLEADYERARSSLENAFTATRSALDGLTTTLETKRERPFEALPLTQALPQQDPQAVERVNGIVRQHNAACEGLQARSAEARRRLEAHFVAAGLADFKAVVAAVDKAQTAADAAWKEKASLDKEIAALEKDIIQHRLPAEELNEELQNYLGHSELRLDVKATGYAIARNGGAASALSEGETTAIALLYFLKALKDQRFDLERGVVVLDDPVSSLDANALYLAFGLIRERTAEAAQVFIFTHNFTFFRQVRNWFHHLKGQKKKDVSQRPARFYMLECSLDGGRRCSRIRALDPLLEQYESEYHYLFASVQRSATVGKPAGLEENYSLPNIARRLLEAFLAFRQPDATGELWQKVKDAKFPEARKLRILRFLHTHSHGDAVAEPEHDLAVLGEGNAVLCELLEFIKSQDPDHFAAMGKLVAAQSKEEDEG